MRAAAVAARLRVRAASTLSGASVSTVGGVSTVAVGVAVASHSAAAAALAAGRGGAIGGTRSRPFASSVVASPVDGDSDADFKPRTRTSADDPAALKKRVEEVRSQ